VPEAGRHHQPRDAEREHVKQEDLLNRGHLSSLIAAEILLKPMNPSATAGLHRGATGERDEEAS
jgi:hypothetical protein